MEPFPSELNQILEKYEQVFTNKLGCFNAAYSEFNVNEGAEPVLKKSRSSRIALISKVEDTITKLVKKKINICTESFQ